MDTGKVAEWRRDLPRDAELPILTTGGNSDHEVGENRVEQSTDTDHLSNNLKLTVQSDIL